MVNFFDLETKNEIAFLVSSVFGKRETRLFHEIFPMGPGSLYYNVICNSMNLVVINCSSTLKGIPWI